MFNNLEYCSVKPGSRAACDSFALAYVYMKCIIFSQKKTSQKKVTSFWLVNLVQ